MTTTETQDPRKSVRGRSVTQLDWTPPEFSESSLKWAVASSVIEEFAQGHSFADILRELVQNEYDAEGDSLAVTFAEDGLSVHGNGKIIDRAGWRRLSVMLGTGRVASDGRDVPQKVSSIGSKNHGLRALFLIGDRIFIRSGGRQTVLDRHLGTPAEPVPDPSSAQLLGAHIFVPYRHVADGPLAPYTHERIARDTAALPAKVAPALLKLAEPDARRSVHLLTVTSELTGSTLTWRQKTKLVKRLPHGGRLVERSIELRQSLPDASGPESDKITELEYQRVVVVPPHFRSRDFPRYFRIAGGRLRIGLSLRLKRRRPDVQDAGSFYYPLGMSNGATGSAVSVNAPFEMNSDRSALVDVEASEWNAWLAEQAADFAIELLSGEWLDAFGADAFLVLRRRSNSPFPRFAERLATSLEQAECWPSRALQPKSRRPRLRRASDLIVGTSPQLDALLGDVQRLLGSIATPPLIAMALGAGAKEFTLSSAVRLRCAGTDRSALRTVANEHESDLHYVNFPGALVNADLQKQFGEAFDAHRRQLTAAHRGDLRDAPTTLTEAGTLAAPSDPLWLLDDELSESAPVAPEQRLHGTLTECVTLCRLCKPFDATAWALKVAEKATAGATEEHDREALYRYLLKRPKAIRAGAWSTLRKAPILRDHRGEWAAASEMLDQRTAKATRIEPVLRFPSSEIRRSRDLLRLLRLRSKLTGRDLIDYSEFVSEHPDHADDIEETLHQLRSLLTPRTVTALRSIPFLPTSRGGAAPEDSYVRSQVMVNCIGNGACYAIGHRPTLEARIGCRTTPEAADIVAHLTDLRESGSEPPAVGVVYPALLEALRKEGELRRFVDAPIIFLEGAWHAPRAVLVGRRHSEIFLGAVPVLTSSGLASVFLALGAASEPTLDHWLAFFAWLEVQSEGGRLPLAPQPLRSLRLAYAALGTLPGDIPDDVRAFVDDQGMLHSRADALAGLILINDDPAMSEAVARAGLPISFAATPDAVTRRFCQTSGVLPLTVARKRTGTRIGGPGSGPGWFDEQKVLGMLHSPVLASAVHAVAASTGSQTASSKQALLKRLMEIEQVAFVTDIEDVFALGRSRISVPTTWALEERQLALCTIKSKNDLYGLLALAIASLAESRHDLSQPLADAIFRLLRSDDPGDMEHYLTQRGVPWTTTESVPAEDVGLLADRAEVVETLADQLLRRATVAPESMGRERPAAPSSKAKRASSPRTPLLPLEEVVLLEVGDSQWSPKEPEPRDSVRRRSQWTPRSPKEQEEDRLLGERGEELVYREERRRVAELGFSEDRVKWTSESDPGADHDILSVADDGGCLWLEVKSTTGRHGRFDWSRAEFELALAARDRYVLCRVYEADSGTARVRRLSDPIAQLLCGDMRLDISSLSAEIAPLTKH